MVRQIDVTELSRRLGAGEPTFLVDVRQQWEHELAALPAACWCRSISSRSAPTRCSRPRARWWSSTAITACGACTGPPCSSRPALSAPARSRAASTPGRRTSTPESRATSNPLATLSAGARSLGGHLAPLHSTYRSSYRGVISPPRAIVRARVLLVAPAVSVAPDARAAADRPVLPELVARRARGRPLVLVAPPGAGKTTRVPGALLDAGWPARRRDRRAAAAAARRAAGGARGSRGARRARSAARSATRCASTTGPAPRRGCASSPRAC